MAAATSISTISSSTFLSKLPTPPPTSSRIHSFLTLPQPLPSQNRLRRLAIPLKPPPFSSIIPQIPKPTKTPKTHLPSPSINSMFTGIVEEMGQIKNLGFQDQETFTMTIKAETILQGIHLGDSISVNGTCLTVTNFDTQLSEFTVGLAPETLRKTSLGGLGEGSVVNLERAVCPSTRMGGHFVQGHVDGTGEIVSLIPEGDSLWVKVRVEKELLRYVVPKGFIAIDGASLTVVDVFDEEGCFNFMLVAYTQENVVISKKKVGEKVNVEVDILGKYVERLLSSGFLENLKSA